MNIARLVREQIRAALRNVRQAVRAVLTRPDPTQKNIGMEVEGLAGERIAAELMQHYGFTSCPQPGAELVVLPIGGRTSHSVVIASEDGRYRIHVAPGEVALYTDEGDHIHMKRGRIVDLLTDTLNITATTAINIQTVTLTTTATAAINTNTDVMTTVADSAINTQTKVVTTAAENAVNTITDTMTMVANTAISNRTATLTTQADSAINVMTEAVTAKVDNAIAIDTPNITQTGTIAAAGDVTAGNISLMQHKHKDTQPGDGESGEPV